MNPFGQKSLVFACGLLIVLATFIAYVPSVGNGFTNWDDQILLTQNADIRSLSWESLSRFFDVSRSAERYHHYHPLVLLSFALEYHISGVNPVLYHTTNICLHIINSLLLFWLALLITRKISIAFLAGLFFGLHPLHVESVAWVTERKDMLCTLFYSFSLVTYLLWRRKSDRRWLYRASILSFALALLSKAMAITLPLVIVLLDFQEDRKIEWRNFRRYLPYMLLSLIFSYIAYVGEHGNSEVLSPASYSMIESIILAHYGIIFYLSKLILPIALSCHYPFLPKMGWLLAWQYMVAPLILWLLIVLLWKNRHRMTTLIFGSWFFFLTLLPVLQIIPVGNAPVADRFVYISSFGFFIVLGEWFSLFVEKKKVITSILVLIVLIVLGATTYSRTKIWKDSISLWTNVLESESDDPFALNNRGVAYLDIFEIEKAKRDFGRAIRSDSSFALAHNNLGLASLVYAQYDTSIECFTKAIELKPNFPLAYYNRGVVYSETKQYEKAIREYSLALERDPGHGPSLNNRANAYARLKKYVEALRDYNTIIGLDPTYAEALSNRAFFWLEMSNPEQALADLSAALASQPRRIDLLVHRAFVHIWLGEKQKGRADFRDALAIDSSIARNLITSSKRIYRYRDRNLTDTALFEY